PFFYGSFVYLYGRLAGRWPVAIVPGVSSLMACAGAAETPLALRNQSLTVLPGPLPEAELRLRLGQCEAAAIIKVGRHLAKIRAVLEELGLTDRARYVERASLGTQRVLPLREAAAGEAPYFSMILVQGKA
ncbi:MAG TPA: SAM-dependent methyltransferase, partial [Dongiaceae bacterium]